ncbi:MarC family protein [Breoghania sp. L-A4]|uniref:MarC family protein n=1 Tax=Breoghania sp. L-A4 TaxID=2304600 RepID=UPI000E35D716|nr:MarC family protein [Breoghania sp. L-A4]AXS41635.1 MarC family protein [Breoghania sp. L-A4]
MEGSIGHAASVFAAFFAIMNPVANTPVFLSLTAGDDSTTRRQVALRGLALAFAIIVVFSLAGNLIFQVFGITLPAFRITGGLLVFLVGFHMVQGDTSKVQQPSAADAKASRQAALDVAIAPLAVPILAGPGTIATAINFSTNAGISGLVVTIAAFFALCVVSYGFFISGNRFVAYLGDNGIKIVTRIMGLILAVVGTQMVIAGVGGAVKLFQAG